jgi:alkanesulfonate monooxygenase SsuD/methylene tetrahydromethanopterin reductase-like flavin-dependent oxidoreductase (luciferase family)
MIALARDMADGAVPAGLPPAFTAEVREALGPDKLLAVGLSVITDTADRETAWGQGTRRGIRLAQPVVVRGDHRPAGLSGSRDRRGGRRTRQRDRRPRDPESIVATVAAHLAAGADHVILLPPAGGGGADLMTGVGQLEQLAPALPH